MNKYKYDPIKMTPFKWFVLENFPFIEEDFDSLTSYGLWCKLKNYFDKVKNKTNELGTQTENLTNAFIQLENYVNNYFKNLDVQDEINNKLDEMAENGTLQEIIVQYIDENIARTYENVSTMVSATNLLNNMKVQTLGYHSAGDGGKACYIIKETNENEDGGSIINLSNGKQAHLIIENNIINYKQFGAYLNNGDDSQAIINCHNFANANKIDIIQNGGNLKCNFTVTVKTNLKLNCNLMIDNSTPGIVFDVKHDLETITDTLVLKANLDTITNQALLNKFCCPILDDEISRIGNRNNPTDTSVYYHKQPLAVNRAGDILTSAQFIAHSGDFQLLGYSDLDEKGVTIEGGNIICTMTKIGFPVLIRLWRNNSIVKNFNIKIQQYGDKNNGRYSNALFMSFAGCHHLFENIYGLNNTIQEEDYSYIFSARYSWDITLRNCKFSQGWGNIASFWVDTILFDNCVSNRFENHYGLFGLFTVRDCTITGIGKIRLGYGTGQALIDNLKSNKNRFSSIIETRDDFNIIYQGEIIVNNFNDKENRCTALVVINESQQVNNFPNVLPTTHFNNVKLYADRRFLFSNNTSRLQCFVNNCQNTPLRVIGDVEVYANNSRFNLLENSSRLWLTGCEITTDNMLLNRLYAKATEFRQNINIGGLSLLLGCHFTAQCTTLNNSSEDYCEISNCFSDTNLTKNGNFRTYNCNDKV